MTSSLAQRVATRTSSAARKTDCDESEKKDTHGNKKDILVKVFIQKRP